MGSSVADKITWFSDVDVNGITLPERFTFPFYYDPHPLARMAAAELQRYLETHPAPDHNFGLTADTRAGAIGKMFGVLVVADAEGRLGYLSAFSGKLGGTNDHDRFVPPVFDMLTENSFFLQEQEVIQSVNAQVEEIENDERYHRCKDELEKAAAQSAIEIADLKLALKHNKEARRLQRAHLAGSANRDQEEAAMAKQSHYDRHRLRELKAKWKGVLDALQATAKEYEVRIEALKNERRERSAALQAQLFEQYSFLNMAGERRSLQSIFSQTAFGRPPSGAGECATPKLLQYAFVHHLKPLAMAEFWWGSSPVSEIRRHRQFYPACAGKCKPILAHMLEGMPVEENPFLRPAKDGMMLQIVYQDAWLVVVNKPPGLRSVPGVDIYDSVYSRLSSLLADAEPLIVHRLDMGTSGLLVLAKTQDVHKHLQRQFLERKVTKRYNALLSKEIAGSAGEISLPLRPDPFNRPMQLVCFDSGKKSITRWQVVERTGGATRIHFWPLTGRTHQLRMHAAHELGLNAPIIGDDLYGTANKRLYLHAGQLSFLHPVTRQTMHFEVAEDF